MNDFNRNIFTNSKPSLIERLLDIALAIALGLIFAVGLLHSLDALIA